MALTLEHHSWTARLACGRTTNDRKQDLGRLGRPETELCQWVCGGTETWLYGPWTSIIGNVKFLDSIPDLLTQKLWSWGPLAICSLKSHIS